jgi:hypothetical protein
MSINRNTEKIKTDLKFYLQRDIRMGQGLAGTLQGMADKALLFQRWQVFDEKTNISIQSANS